MDVGANGVRSVAVYCGSSAGTNVAYLDAARELGRLLAHRSITLVYGGGRVGLMGAVADACLASGGRAIGVITESLMEAEVGHHGLSQLEVVPTMHDRKFRMADLSDAFLALPGGFGTLDELCEVVTWTQLGIHRKPSVLVNVLGYWDPMLAQVERAISDGFLKESHRGLLWAADTPAAALDLLGSDLAIPEPKWIAGPPAR